MPTAPLAPLIDRPGTDSTIVRAETVTITAHTPDPFGMAQFALIATAGDEDVATLQYDVTPCGLAIQQIEVAEDYRRRGIATRLYDEMRGRHPGLRILRDFISDVGIDFRNAYDTRRHLAVPRR